MRIAIGQLIVCLVPRASCLVPRATGRRDRVEPASHHGAHRPLHGAEIDPGRLLPRCSERGHTRALPIEESVILVTV